VAWSKKREEIKGRVSVSMRCVPFCLC
jgi:hypothetical protein